MAYDVLSDEKKRALYDAHGIEGIKEGGGATGSPFDVFGNMFGFGGEQD